MKILEVLLQYGVLGVIAYFFLNQNTKLFNSLLDRSRSDSSMVTSRVDSIKESFEDLSSQLTSSVSRLSESIQNEKAVSKTVFLMITEIRIESSKYELITMINDAVDMNGFSDTTRYQLLIENIVRFCEASRMNLVDQVGSGISYDEVALKAISDTIDRSLEGLSQSLSEILKVYPQENFSNDKNYRIFKNVLYNEVSKYYEKATSISKKGVVR